MRAHIEKLGGSVELGSTLVGFAQDEDGVIAEMVKTINGEELKEISKFKYLVGADGGHSMSNSFP